MLIRNQACVDVVKSDLLAQAIIMQGFAGLDDIHDCIRHIDGRGQFYGPIQLDDLHGLLDGIKILSGEVHVLCCNYWINVLLLFAGDGEMAIAEWQIHQIVDVAVLLDQNIASGDAQIRDPFLHIYRDIFPFNQNEAGPIPEKRTSMLSTIPSG